MFGHRNDLKPKRIWLVSALDEDNSEVLNRAFRYKCEARTYRDYLASKEGFAVAEIIELMLY